MPNELTAADALRFERALYHAGVNVKQLARLSGIEAGLLQAYFNGDKSIADDGHANRIANLLGVSVRWLLTGMPSKAAQDAIASYRRDPHFARIAPPDSARMIAFLEMLPAADEIDTPATPIGGNS